MVSSIILHQVDGDDFRWPLGVVGTSLVLFIFTSLSLRWLLLDQGIIGLVERGLVRGSRRAIAS